MPSLATNCPNSWSPNGSRKLIFCHYFVTGSYFPDHEIIFFVLLFPKNEQPNLTPEQEKTCRVLANRSSRHSTRDRRLGRNRKEERTQ